jgi:hypothetical protein
VSLGGDMVLAYGNGGRFLYGMATGKVYAPDKNTVSYSGGPYKARALAAQSSPCVTTS